MHTREIPPEQWEGFVKQFSRDHAGWLASIEIVGPELGVQKEAEWQPLQGISLDTKGTQASSVTISVGDSPDAYIRHRVELPLHIRQVSGPDAESVDLQIEPAQGPQTLIHLRGASGQE